MQRFNVVVLLCLLLACGSSVYAADNNWTAAGNTAPWSVDDNWSLGVIPTIDDKPRISGDTACILDFATQTKGVVFGYGGAAGTLIIEDGGSLQSIDGGWVGMQGEPGTLEVRKGGSFSCDNHFWCGLYTASDGATIILNGGTVTVGDAFALGWGDAQTHAGYANINSGTLDVRYVPDSSKWRTGESGSVMDIKWGTFKVNGDQTGWVNGMLGTGITAFGGTGTLNVEVIDGKTVVTANNPYAPSPDMEETIPIGDVELSWTNLDPNTEGNSVYVDIWFGTEPNDLSGNFTKVVTAGENTTSVTVSAPTPGQYYWQVDSYLGGTATGTPVPSDTFTFFASNDFPPTVDAGPSMISWDSQDTQLDATVDDDGTSTLTIEWSSDNENVVFSATDIEDPIVSLANGTVDPITATLTLKAYDELNTTPVVDTMTLTVYSNACQAARVGAGLAADYPGDFNGDCIVNLEDLTAEIAAKWLDNYTLTDPIDAI